MPLHELSPQKDLLQYLPQYECLSSTALAVDSSRPTPRTNQFEGTSSHMLLGPCVWRSTFADPLRSHTFATAVLAQVFSTHHSCTVKTLASSLFARIHIRDA